MKSKKTDHVVLKTWHFYVKLKCADSPLTKERAKPYMELTASLWEFKNTL